MWNKSIINYWA